MEASGSTIDHDRDSMVEVSGDDAEQGGNESDSSSDLQQSAADSGPESATGDCLMFSDTEEAVINSTHKKFWKKVWVSCSIAKGCLWYEIGDNCHTAWGTDHEVIKTEWDLTLMEDCSSFEVNKMTTRTNQLLWIKEATSSKIHPCELEAEVYGRKKTLVQLLNQFHAHFYQLYKKGKTPAMVILQGLHLGNTFRCPNVSASMGLKSFCPWCLKLGGDTKAIAIHSQEVHYRMAIM